jgi:hypothetical protein
MGQRVYPQTPDLRSARTQGLTDGELFYAIEQGIPWTAMPGWTTGTSEGEQESWALVRFMRHLPAITPDELKEMERLNPKPPPNPEHEREIEDFLTVPCRSVVEDGWIRRPARPSPEIGFEFRGSIRESWDSFLQGRLCPDRQWSQDEARLIVNPHFISGAAGDSPNEARLGRGPVVFPLAFGITCSRPGPVSFGSCAEHSGLRRRTHCSAWRAYR